MRTLIFRDFAFYDNHGNVESSYNSISIYLYKNNTIFVVIDDCDFIQAFMVIKYVVPKFEYLYDIINKILNTITYDLYRNKKNMPLPRDFILHDHKKMKNRKIWNKDIEKNSMGAKWISYTRENMKYVTIEDDEVNFGTSIVIKGNVDDNGEFTYDFPIVSSNCSIETYTKSRGNMDYFSFYQNV